jgi:imidazolonepropionase-like amidohydrolase
VGAVREPSALGRRPSAVCGGLLWVAAALVLGACAKREAQPAADAVPPPEPYVAITHVTVVDVAKGVLVPGQNVVMRGGRIVSVGDTLAVSVPPRAEIVDGRGKFLIPGLWDMHVHAFLEAAVARAFLPAFAAHGVTGIRDMGGKLDVLRAARWAVLAGTLVGPRIVAAGAVLDGPPTSAPRIAILVGDTLEVRSAVDSLVRGGADFIKVYTNLRRDVYFAVLREAARRHLPVAGRLPVGVTGFQAADSGQRSIEHLRYELMPLCVAATDRACLQLLDSLRAHGVALVPTLVVLRVGAILNDSSLVRDPRLPTVPGPLSSAWDTAFNRYADRPPAYWREQRTRFFGALALTGAAWRDGVPLLAGTDAGALFTYPGSSLHEELVQLVRAGLTPAAALRAATLAPAEFLGATDSLGTVAVGKVADLVLLGADPLADVANTRSIEAVVLRGRLFRRAALDSLVGPVRHESLAGRAAPDTVARPDSGPSPAPSKRF